MESQQCSKHLFIIHTSLPLPGQHPPSGCETQKWLFHFSHQSNRLTMFVVTTLAFRSTEHRRWVTSTEISAALTTHRQLLLHSLVFHQEQNANTYVNNRRAHTHLLSPTEAPRTILCVCLGVSAIKSLRQLAHYFVFRCKPFNLAPCASTIDRQAKNGKLTPKRCRPFPARKEHMWESVCVSVSLKLLLTLPS